MKSEQILGEVQDVLASTQVIDIHTHLFSPAFGKIGLWGIDKLLTYHYLESEFFRSSDTTPEEYWKLSKTERADAIWQALFVENSPISESTRGVVAVLDAFGLPTNASGLQEARRFFGAQSIQSHIRKVLQIAGASDVVMTNDPLDPEERPVWMSGGQNHPQFHAVIRLDRILWGWPQHWQQLASEGYAVDERASGKSIDEVRRFLADWHKRMRPLYMAVSLADTFQFPDERCITSKLLSDAVLPSCRELGLPMSLMIGVRRQVNPRLRLAGDAVGKADLRSIENLCREFPENRFLVSVLSRENQHELAVYARKFNNLMPFGCWWFLNNPSIVEEITRERIELLGTSFIPQHSDARVLEQVIYKWHNTRRTLAPILANAYQLLLADGAEITRQKIQRDVNRLFRTNFQKWTGFRDE
ncbi:MAG: glucuronate isomerase [Acidobacteria bacterium]|nr:MAG: glucuronate isomerase [Acidobacteriota bacterium]